MLQDSYEREESPRNARWKVTYDSEKEAEEGRILSFSFWKSRIAAEHLFQELKSESF